MEKNRKNEDRNDFENAHHWHWEGAEILFENNHWAGADHLYGLSAECGVKHLMILFGMRTDNNNHPKYEDRQHINGLSSRYDVYRSQRYSLEYTVDFSPFKNWSISDRYKHDAKFSRDIANDHRDATRKIGSLLKKARLDGITQ